MLEGQVGQLFQRALWIWYVRSLPPTLLSNTVKPLAIDKARVLSTLYKH